MGRATRLTPVILVFALLAAGCVDIHAASIPTRLLGGANGNGWVYNATASQAEPASSSFGFTKTQAFVYEDRTSRDGYAGVLVVTTLRAVPSPSDDRVREHIQQTVRDEAVKKGINIKDEPRVGTRSLANGATSSWFAYSGNVTSGSTFVRDAEVRILGEVFTCAAQKTIVATVGLVQVTDVKSVFVPGVGRVQEPSDRDTTTWREIVSDPTGQIEAIRGSDGLAYNVGC